MVNPISNLGSSPIDTARTTAPIAVPVDAKPAAKAEREPTPAVRLTRLGPPIDMNRVGEIRSAIANGSYTVDADRLAAAMIALDLPVRGA